MFKKIGKIALSLFMMLTIMTVNYALDVDNIFGITASAASYSEKATSMLEFYKNGTQLDKKKVSNDELYVFGVFVSNFLMPFQSRTGSMSSDSFVTKMAATFFGDAYTAQQLSDMKYTLGLVQSAQSDRRRLINCSTGSPVSVNTLYKSFTGFYAPTQSAEPSQQVYYTYENSGYNVSSSSKIDPNYVVWESGTSVFDAILGQLISICPSQAGVYMGTSGNLTSNLYIDCFGNISDANGVIIVPACMNPFAFYNRYLDGNRKPTQSMGNDCPIQLPINNAFWMGTMVTPQSLSMRVGIPDTQAKDVEVIDSDEEQLIFCVAGMGSGVRDARITQYVTVLTEAQECDLDTAISAGADTIGIKLTPTDIEKLAKGITSLSDLVSSWDTSCQFGDDDDSNCILAILPAGITRDSTYYHISDAIDTMDAPDCLSAFQATAPVFAIDSLYAYVPFSYIEKKPSLGGRSVVCLINSDCAYIVKDDDDASFDFSLDANGHVILKAEGAEATALLNNGVNHECTGGSTCSVCVISSTSSNIKTSEPTVTNYNYAVKDCYIALPNLYIPINEWTDSTTSLIGINTLDGDELGIYFSEEINSAFKNAWRLASGHTDATYEDLVKNYLVTSRDGYYDAWNFVGGTSVPISLVLDDIALFDTYNNFSDSVASSISTISMYKDKSTGLWWAADGTHGSRVKSVYREIIDGVTTYVSNQGYGDWFAHLSDIAKFYQGYDATPNDKSDDSASNYTKVDEIWNWVMSIDVDYYTQGAETETDIINNIVANSTPQTLDTYDINIGASGLASGIISNCPAIGWAATPTDTFAKRAFLAAVFDDPAWLISANTGGYKFSDDLLSFVIIPSIAVEGDYGTGKFVNDIQYLGTTDSSNQQDRLISLGADSKSAIPNQDAIDSVATGFDWSDIWGSFSKAFSTAVYKNHVFLQKAHPSMQDETTVRGWGSVALYYVGVILVGIAAIILAAVVLAGAALSGGFFLIAGVGLVCLVASLVTAINQTSSIQAQKNALAAYYGSGKFKSRSALLAEDAQKVLGDDTLTLESSNSDPAVLRLADKYSDEALAGNIYVSDYTLYGPYGSLGSALGSVAQVYTENGVVDGDKISTKTGSYITQDVNLWGGIYYAYMVDIFGLDVSEDNVMSAAQLQTNFPPVPNNLTGQTNPDLSSLLNSGDDIDSEEQETEKRRELMNRFDLMTGLSTAADYVSQWLSKTLNGYLIQAHNGITGASGSGSVSNIGSGSIYTGYSSYLSTASLSEMPFTSWVMQYYNVIYITLMILIIIIAAFMCISGHRTIRKTIFAVLLMSVILLLPRLCVDSLVSISNLAAQSVYNDRFGFWTYVQHQQYMTQINDAEAKDDKIEFMIVTNMQQAKDYYSAEKGVTIKWMSPKKTSYWDAINSISGGSSDSLNLSIFKWMFQGQFNQTQYSTDPLATYVYRPYTDIAMSARSLDTTSITSVNPSFGKYSKYKDSSVLRAKYANTWVQGITSYASKLGVDWDIKPAHMTYNATTGSVGAKNIPVKTSSNKSTSPSLIAYNYAYGLYNSTINKVALGDSSFVESSDTQGYLKAYPSIKNSMGTNAAGTTAGMQNVEDSGKVDANVEMYYLYSESPYYYFYQVFKTMRDEFGSGEMRKLLMSERYFKYQETENPDAAGKGDVREGEIQDFLDLEGLFTFVIPYLQESNYYVDEWTSLWGTTVESSDPEGFSDNLKGIWKMYAPWVDAMYDTDYVSGTIRIAGSRYSLNDTINPGSYSELRPMVFGSADASRNFVATADMSEVEKRIIRVLENTYKDLMYLNNYADFDDEVLLSAAAMAATFNFNECFSETDILGDNVTLYPTGYEVKNFSYDSFMRMSLMNTTGASVFSDEDIYTTVLDNTSFITGVLLIVNDAVACYVLPVFKLVLLIGLFFLGLLICVGGFLSPPEKIIKFIAKQYLLPLVMFFGILLANILISSLFVGEGLTNYVGQRAVTITTGDPTMTILLMLAINCLICFGFYMTLKVLLKSFKVSCNWVVGASLGFMGAVLHKARSTVKGVTGAGTRIVAGTARGAGKVVSGTVGGVSSAINSHRLKKREDKNVSKLYNAIKGKNGDSKTDSDGKARAQQAGASDVKSATSVKTEPKGTPPKANLSKSFNDDSKNGSSTFTKKSSDGSVTTNVGGALGAVNKLSEQDIRDDAHGKAVAKLNTSEGYAEMLKKSSTVGYTTPEGVRGEYQLRALKKASLDSTSIKTDVKAGTTSPGGAPIFEATTSVTMDRNTFVNKVAGITNDMLKQAKDTGAINDAGVATRVGNIKDTKNRLFELKGRTSSLEKQIAATKARRDTISGQLGAADTLELSQEQRSGLQDAYNTEAKELAKQRAELSAAMDEFNRCTCNLDTMLNSLENDIGRAKVTNTLASYAGANRQNNARKAAAAGKVPISGANTGSSGGKAPQMPNQRGTKK